MGAPRRAQGAKRRVHVRHPHAGELELLVEKFAAVDADGLEALLLHAEPGTSSAEALALLTTRTAANSAGVRAE